MSLLLLEVVVIRSEEWEAMADAETLLLLLLSSLFVFSLVHGAEQSQVSCHWFSLLRGHGCHWRVILTHQGVVWGPVAWLIQENLVLSS